MNRAPALHATTPAGKLGLVLTKPCDTPDDFSLACSQGVAAPCLAIRADPAAVLLLQPTCAGINPEDLRFGAQRRIPRPFDSPAVVRLAAAVATSAMEETGRAGRPQLTRRIRPMSADKPVARWRVATGGRS
ncbi:MAG: hypothetical protein AB7O28_07305 [Vicinamibacterales bacterium]